MGIRGRFFFAGATLEKKLLRSAVPLCGFFLTTLKCQLLPSGFAQEHRLVVATITGGRICAACDLFQRYFLGRRIGAGLLKSQYRGGRGERVGLIHVYRTVYTSRRANP
ncbi:hypothetical protein Nepgr_014307 [Nepenthes gracilis]|uniref:Uncharacterized protein n=1 Tax=Nepenthes gracilis TaxID=150966 RepID=A0AAD3XQ62_NEPGR|nr:hypothetical protein Nepgr_014307 [Nepenthes gracilis]